MKKNVFLQSRRYRFGGLLISKDEIKLDPAKVEALNHAGPPENKEDVMSFLRMIQSLSNFIPNLSQKTFNLRQLTKKHVHFRWKNCHQLEFDNLRNALHKNILLMLFQPQQPTLLYVDAHITGLSATLIQGTTIANAKPVAFSSTVKTLMESCYLQLNLEAQAIDFGLRCFSQYLTGGPPLIIITDHKPLVAIFSNNHQGSIIWRQGSSNPSSYLSSHAMPFYHLPHEICKEAGEFEKTVCFLQYDPYIEAISVSKIIKETKAGKLLSKLIHHIKNIYPEVSIQFNIISENI